MSLIAALPALVAALALLEPSSAASSAPPSAAASTSTSTGPASSAPRWRLDGGLALTATSTSSNVETSLQPWLILRTGRLFSWGRDPDGVSAGFDASVWLGGYAREGTPEIATTRFYGALEGRALWSPGRVSSTWSAFLPYCFAGALAGAGLTHLQAFDDTSTRPLGTWAVRAGGGLELLIHGITTRLELGAGLRDLRPELASTLTLGAAF